jgi:predicted membrane protein
MSLPNYIANICPPALIFIIFSLVQIIFDLIRGVYNAAFFKGILLVMVGLLLNLLCQQGLSIISWVIIFIPFIFMSTVVAILLYTFGLNPTSGTLNTTCEQNDEDKKQGEELNDDDNDNEKIIIRQGNIIHTN